MKIAMWSGPRNMSTALMYAFGNRADCAIWDEPFYAAYLRATGIDHPMRDAVLAAHETDPHAVARTIRDWSGPAPHLYMKHMTFHMVDGFPFDWADDCVHLHLIRHPARVAASYAAKRENPTAADLGFESQQAIWERFPGPVIDSGDLRRDPARILGLLCAEIGLPMSGDMLSWPPGPRPEDGVWAAHWYGAVHRSTGFATGDEPPLPELTPVAAQGLALYEAMRAEALR